MSGVAFVAAVAALLLALAWGASFLASSDRARHAVEDLGYTNVEVVSRGLGGVFGGCSSDDNASFKVRGVDPSGRTRTVKVCAQLIGGYTVRN